MTSFADHAESNLIKAIIAGVSGRGKTGLLATLINSPLIKRTAILDFDQGLQILSGYLNPDARERVQFETLDPFAPASGQRAITLAKHWNSNGVDWGKPEQWGPEDLFVVDTLSGAGQAFLTMIEMGGQFKDGRQIVGKAQEGLLKFVGHLVYKAKCHVIFNTHIRAGEDLGEKMAYPSTVGSALNTQIGKYFNNVWRIDLRASEPSGRIIRVAADHAMTLKNSAPNVLKKEEPFDLAALFTKILSAKALPSNALTTKLMEKKT